MTDNLNAFEKLKCSIHNCEDLPSQYSALEEVETLLEWYTEELDDARIKLIETNYSLEQLEKENSALRDELREAQERIAELEDLYKHMIYYEG